MFRERTAETIEDQDGDGSMRLVEYVLALAAALAAGVLALVR